MHFSRVSVDERSLKNAHVSSSPAVLNERLGRPAFPMSYEFPEYAREEDTEEARFASELHYRENHGKRYVPIEEVMDQNILGELEDPWKDIAASLRR